MWTGKNDSHTLRVDAFTKAFGYGWTGPLSISQSLFNESMRIFKRKEGGNLFLNSLVFFFFFFFACVVVVVFPIYMCVFVYSIKLLS